MIKPASFWVINISKVNVMLADLYLNIPTGCYYNLLDSKHFHYSWEQIEKSATSGSLYKKQDKIKQCGEEKPNFGKKLKPEMSTIPAVKPVRSIVEVVEPNYDALLFSDESYANEIAELFDDKKI